ncbi:CTR1-like protein kinase [Ectocarpus siliculosus]|uniref:CTR1-like protein kinase n=1 Tax=Ectocarpus siliculosus TaxID=2880 RepID=D7FXE3_ECTSI|nr:CTR1-like protein kinase [Ectocarpus siliculosus]|eukprot:CBJ32280.1 CTR1-like protein kinase [Ectocarpus siliculosus]
MIRLRSPHTVIVYGAVTSLADRMVLVVELLFGGPPNAFEELLAAPSPGAIQAHHRRHLRGNAFLHSKDRVHDDLKSTSMLLDGSGREKMVAAHQLNRLATYTTRSSQSTQVNIAWSAPEVLESGGSTYASDVYSFGIVVWEVVSGERPWANTSHHEGNPVSAVDGGAAFVPWPCSIVDMAKACRDEEPHARTTYDAVMECMKSYGRHELCRFDQLFVPESGCV